MGAYIYICIYIYILYIYRSDANGTGFIKLDACFVAWQLRLQFHMHVYMQDYKKAWMVCCTCKTAKRFGHFVASGLSSRSHFGTQQLKVVLVFVLAILFDCEL